MTLMGRRRWFGRSTSLRRTVAALRHELVELGLVLGVPQAIKEIAELALLLFKPPKRLGAIFIEGAIAAGRWVAPPIGAGAHSSAHAVHLFLHALHFALPTVHSVLVPAAHSSTPYDEGQCRKAQRPPETKPEDHEHDPGRPS